MKRADSARQEYHSHDAGCHLCSKSTSGYLRYLRYANTGARGGTHEQALSLARAGAAPHPKLRTLKSSPW